MKTLGTWTDGRTDRVIPIYPPNFVCGGYNKTKALLQTTEDEDEPNIVFILKMEMDITTQNVKTYDRTKWWTTLYVSTKWWTTLYVSTKWWITLYTSTKWWTTLYVSKHR